MKYIKSIFLILAISIIILCQSCREDIYIFEEEIEDIEKPNILEGDVQGFYLLNEGNMGMNRASIDFFNYETGAYHRDIFSNRNPSVVKELGDVGNDIQIYGSILLLITILPVML